MKRGPHDSHKIILRKTKKYGYGVFSKERIRKGHTVAVFDGKIYDDNFEHWTKDLLNHAIQIAQDKWRDSKGVARYINHSCDPNCGIRGLNKVVAMRTIEPGEEITWDYEMTEASDWWMLKCKCGSLNCRRVIGNFHNMPRSVRRRYRGYISTWLIRPRRRKLQLRR